MRFVGKHVNLCKHSCGNIDSLRAHATFFCGSKLFFREAKYGYEFFQKRFVSVASVSPFVKTFDGHSIFQRKITPPAP